MSAEVLNPTAFMGDAEFAPTPEVERALQQPVHEPDWAGYEARLGHKGDTSAREQLVIDCLPLAYEAAQKSHTTARETDHAAPPDPDDHFQDAVERLLSAAQGYNPVRHPSLQEAIMSSLRNDIEGDDEDTPDPAETDNAPHLVPLEEAHHLVGQSAETAYEDTDREAERMLAAAADWLTVEQWAVVHELSRSPQPSQTAVAQRLRISRPVVKARQNKALEAITDFFPISTYCTTARCPNR